MIKKCLLAVMLAAMLVVGLQALALDNERGGSETTVSGTWHMSFNGRRGSREATMQLQQDGSKVSGTLEAQGRSMPVTGSIHDNKISLISNGEKHSLSFSGTVAGNRMSGTTQRGASWSATRE